jgi:hypothetical protein
VRMLEGEEAFCIASTCSRGGQVLKNKFITAFLRTPL